MTLGSKWIVVLDEHASITSEFRVCSMVVINYFSGLIHYVHADVLAVLPGSSCSFFSLSALLVSAIGKTQVQSVIPKTVMKLWHAGEVFFKHLLLFRNDWKLNEPLNVLHHVIWEASKAPKHRILIHHSDILQPMLCRCRILSMKRKLYISVLSHNFYGVIHT